MMLRDFLRANLRTAKNPSSAFGQFAAGLAWSARLPPEGRRAAARREAKAGAPLERAERCPKALLGFFGRYICARNILIWIPDKLRRRNFPG